MTPNELAAKLVGKDSAERYGKTFVRPYLRRHFTRDASAKGTSWSLSDAAIAEITAAHKAKVAGRAFDRDAWRKSRKARKPAKPAEPVA